MSIQDQPPPIRTDGAAIWNLVIDDFENGHCNPDLRALVIADMRERDTTGRLRYGTPLQAHNGRDALVDAYQEALDLCAYLRQCLCEGKPVAGLYADAIGMVKRIRFVIANRDRLRS